MFINFLRSTAFLTLLVCSVRYFYCLVSRAQNENNRFTGLATGFLSSYAILLEAPSRRKELALYIAPKALEGMWNYLCRRGLITNIKHLDMIIFAFAMGVIGIGCKAREDFIRPTYNNLFKCLWD